ncbi:DUF1700 domain-containing protein [Acetobacter sp. AN02]|uniref:DUF1700 domain-containing protein n=1 Tax=Acetobacter sp. AN02 TaxID=2894186 RepID=UPI00243418B5|nr:DUF1700 domain-containing protein [Acetobacter sp. AN02]MDG6094632.1 DUF1700 domain-containing protein [Acetobacter sp. AN02]
MNMTGRQIFLDRLRTGLRGLPSEVIEDTVAEYAAHFDAGLAAGHSEADIAASLGDPERLAREIRAEDGVRQWKSTPGPSAAIRAVFGIIGLVAVDILIVLPFLLSGGAIILGLFLVAFVVCLAGTLLLPLAVMSLSPVQGDWLQGVLMSLGLASGGAAVATLCVLVTVLTINLLIRFGRTHYRVVAPAVS